MPTMSSWKASLPTMYDVLWLNAEPDPLMQLVATNLCAVAIPVTKFVAPGPMVAKHTRAFPPAAHTSARGAPCSCLHKMRLILSHAGIIDR